MHEVLGAHLAAVKGFMSRLQFVLELLLVLATHNLRAVVRLGVVPLVPNPFVVLRIEELVVVHRGVLRIVLLLVDRLRRYRRLLLGDVHRKVSLILVVVS